MGSVVGIVVATLGFFVGNRLLPAAASIAGADRETLEMWVFYVTWLLTFAHAAWRGRAAWREQTWAVVALAVLAVAANWLSTGDHLLRAFARGLWGVAGMDVLLLASAGVAALAARRLSRASVPARAGAQRSLGAQDISAEISRR